MAAASDRLDAVFSALADPTRRAILTRLSRGSSTVSELAAPFDMSLPAVSKHLKVLERAGLLRRDVEGRVHHCRLEAGTMKDAADWINRYRAFWERQFAALEKYLERTRGGEQNRAATVRERSTATKPHEPGKQARDKRTREEPKRKERG
ncbi:MAG: metalloregulator ArsR/SmtB family transcription factor [Phycisphaerae bacterium]|jgi:DNA-binding transcriptional ArsR family regulator